MARFRNQTHLIPSLQMVQVIPYNLYDIGYTVYESYSMILTLRGVTHNNPWLMNHESRLMTIQWRLFITGGNRFYASPWTWCFSGETSLVFCQNISHQEIQFMRLVRLNWNKVNPERYDPYYITHIIWTIYGLHQQFCGSMNENMVKDLGLFGASLRYGWLENLSWPLQW